MTATRCAAMRSQGGLIMEAHIEVLPAKAYYGQHSTGIVVLVNGLVAYHATGPTARKDVRVFIDRITKKT